jgi:predicted enzyme related to lactoylglutathione lyase
MAANPVNWFEIYVQDMARAKAFYEGVLQVTLQPLPGGDLRMMLFPGDRAQAGSGGALVQVPGMASGGNSVLVYFRCEDCAVEEARIAAAGGRVQRPKMSIGDYGFVTLGIDTEGNMFGLHSMQ